MRREEIDKLNEQYTDSRIEIDRRFDSSIGSDVPSAGLLVKEIFNDLDETSFGISWWKLISVEERILISDYLYQCADGIEKNLAEAKLHYWEWLDARDRQNSRIADVIKRSPSGELTIKMQPSLAPIDDIPNRLEGLHICGFFRAIGSSLDCLGGAIIGVLGLKASLRKNDIAKARQTLAKIKSPQNPGEKLQIEFRDFLEAEVISSGPEDWLEWADQYRNMFVHRGRRFTYNQLLPRDTPLYDSTGQWIPRATSTLHLAKHPDKSDAEAFIKKDINLNEDADITFKGLFKSCRELEENVCGRLVSIWRERLTNPALIEQPSTQWDIKIRPCKFNGYKSDSEPLGADMMIGNPILRHRMLSASVDDSHRSLWTNSKWNQ